MNILAIGAHPDDIEIGCGGTLIKYSREGHQVYLLVATYGELGGEGLVRAEELRRSAEIIGATDLFTFDYPDTQLPLDKELISRIEEVIKVVSPEVIFVHYFDDTHQDHRTLSQATTSATRYIKNVLFYEVPTTQNFAPTVFIDIDDTLEGKVACLEAHSSQVTKTNIEGLTIVDIARAAAHFRGIQSRVKNAEGFVPLRLFLTMD
ncbi:PIG-L family deacetylase [Nitrospinae bacterium AH_259_B05_G02_I21]|nr:PIG-L family deacetylase [Nitrospinae bacterium AH_259_B05_G02_I21]